MLEHFMVIWQINQLACSKISIGFNEFVICQSMDHIQPIALNILISKTKDSIGVMNRPGEESVVSNMKENGIWATLFVMAIGVG